MKKACPYVIIVFLFLAVRLYGLGTDILNSDGARWYRRSEAFLQAIKSGDFAQTYQHYQPGVTLMWINSATRGVTWQMQGVLKVPRWSLANSRDFPKIHSVSKSALVFVLAALLSYQLFLISKLVDTKTALLYGLLIAIEPYMIGIDRWFHLTSLEVYFAFSAFLTYLYSFKRSGSLPIVATGFFIALSTLSKLTGIVVIPLILGIEVIRTWRDRNINRVLPAAGLIAGAFGITVLLLFPALWVDFSGVMHKLFSAVASAVESDNRGQIFTAPFSYIYYLVILAYKLSPVTLAGLIFLPVMAINSYKSRSSDFVNRLLPIYFLVFFIALTLSAKKIDRYVLALIPCLLLYMSIYLAKLQNKALVLIITLHLALSAFIYLKHFPALSGYYSPIFGGAQSALNLGVYENSGEYFTQAAFYLNSKGRADVFVPDNIESFNYFYSGRSVREFTPSVKYVVSSVDFDRRTPHSDYCPILDKVFGSTYSIPAVYVFRCFDAV